MNPTELPSKISYRDLKCKHDAYSHAVPPKLQTLDTLRYDEIPQLLAQRKQAGSAYLEKTETASLVEWKLKHGTYRPTLAKLVASNSADDVAETTRTAFAIYEKDQGDFGKAISTLAQLKGIGPATASLLLACYDPVQVPFFSDELFRYLHFEKDGKEGWERKIGYTAKEYRSLVEKFKGLSERVAGGKEGGEVKAVEVEKAAYAMSKEAVEHAALDGEGEESDAAERPPASKRRKKAAVEPAPKSGRRDKGRQKGTK